jgi:hypothetical protein
MTTKTKHIDPTSIEYVNTVGFIPSTFTRRVGEHLETFADEYEKFEENRQKAEASATNVRWAVAYAVTSIKTGTGRVDSNVASVAGDFAGLRDMVQDSSDGHTKWSHVHDMFTGARAERVARDLQNGAVMDAHARLCGIDPETGDKSETTYLRPTKASLVLYLLGFDRMCLDTRIWRTIKQPVIQALIDPQKRTHPDTSATNPYRQQAADVSGPARSLWEHSADTDDRTYWEDTLHINPIEYTAVTWYLVEQIHEEVETEHPVGVIPHALFNLSGPTTFHTELWDVLHLAD